MPVRRRRGGPAGGGHLLSVAAALEDAHRREWAFVLAATVRVCGDLDLAEECAQEAYVAALQAWQATGLPERPGAWLTTTARRKALDALRRDSTLRRKLPLLVEPAPEVQEVGVVPDDRLRLLFICCHPALSVEAQVALTLRLVCGVATPDVARLFLVPEATMAARLTRAKKKIAVARIPYRVPVADDLPVRLGGVLATVHLLFTAGHTAPHGERLVHDDAAQRAVDLARLLVGLLPHEPEVRGLCGLLLLTHSRRAARTDRDGRLVLLENQNRARWDGAAVTEGLRLTAEALTLGPRGRYALQAAIAGVHAVAESSAVTDWRRILSLYDQLLHAWPSPVVALNRAVAVSYVQGPEAGLALVDELTGLDAYPYRPAVRARLLRDLGRRDEAAAAYREALALTANAVEQEFLSAELDQLSPTVEP